MKCSLIAALALSGIVAFADNQSYGPGDDIFINASVAYDELVMTGGSVTVNSGATLTVTSLKGQTAEGVTAKIVLNAGGTLCAGDICNETVGALRIEQNGGALQFKHMRSSGNGSLTTVGVNGNDIDITTLDDGGETLFDVENATSVIEFTGDCNFRRTGATKTEQPTVAYWNSAALRFTYTGSTTLCGGRWTHRGGAFPSGTDLILADNVTVDLGGGLIKVGSIRGNGFITTYQPGIITLTSDTVDSDLTMLSGYNITVNNDGAATVTISPESLPAVRANKGRVAIRSRADVGYRCYKFQVTGNRGIDEPYVQLGGLFLMDGETDTVGNVFSPSPLAAFDNGAPNCVFDRDHDNKWFSSPGGAFEVIFKTSQPLDTYTLKTANDVPNRDPRVFSLYGCVDSYNWRLLSSVEGCTGNYNRNSLYQDAPFPVTNFPDHVSLDALKIACGATVDVSGDIFLDPGNVSNEGGTLSLSDGAVLRASGGTTTMATRPVCRNRFWRFEFPSCANGPQFGELGMFDGAGNRVNLSDNIANLEHNGNTTFPNLFDGNFSTQCWVADGGDYWIELELTSVPDCGVLSYALARDASQPGVAYKTPANWKIYTRAQETDEWVLADERVMTSRNNVDGWGLYPGAPFSFPSTAAIYEAPPAAFAASTPVAVAAESVLDLTGSTTELANLIVDCNDAGTIKGGVLASVGTIRIDNFLTSMPEGRLPLRLDGTTVPADLSGWTLTVNGVVRSNYTLRVVDGNVYVMRSGCVLTVR